VVETLNGQSVTVTINDDGIFVNDAQVIVADLEAQNGVVHVIDAVLLPELEEELPETVFDIIQDSEVHETLEVGIIAAQLVDDLESEGPFTVFAPTDDAFDALPDGVLEALLADPRELGEILLYHVLSGQVLAADLMDGQTATTLLGEDITITINDDGVFVNDAQVTVTDLLAQNGVVHVIDAVLIPSEEVDCDEEVEGGTVALEDGSTEITIIVDDEEDVLTFTSEGADEDANFAYVITDDQNNILALPPSNMADLNGAGVGICRVWGLSYTGNITAMMGDNAAEVDLSDECFDLSDNFITVTRVEPELPATVVDIIVNSDVHNTLEAAVIAAELADDLSGEGPFTVFAPTDDAFDALPEGTVEALLEDPTGDLAQILLYHVVSGSVLSTDLMDGMVVETLNGQSVTVTINDDGIFVNDAQVIVADLEAQNGVVHVIDAVLLPEEEEETNTVFDIIANSDIHETLEAAIIAADLDEALQGDGPFTVFAPTDDAFDALPDGVLDALLEGPVGDLQNILLYHVLDGTRTADSFIDGQRVLTRQGQTVTVTINDDGVFINDAQVTVADIAADNGVVHVINAVLVPDDGPSDSFLEIRPPSRVVGAEAGEVIFVVFTNTTWSISGDDDWYEVFIRESSGTKFIKVIYDANEEGPARTAVLTINATTGESETFTLTQSGSDDFVAVTPETIDVSAVMGMTSFDVIASGDYSVDTDADWLTLSEDGNTVNIMYMSNSSFETRSATITVTSAGGATATVTVNQGASEDIDIFFELRPDNLTVSAEAGEAQFVVYTNAIWAISTDADWLEFFVDEGQGTGFIKVIYEANEGATRTATFDIVTSTGESGTFTLTQEGTGGEELPATVVDIIVDSEVHETLETAVIAAGLVDALSGEGPFTVFAPTDEAFAALPEGTVEALLEDPMGQLSQILTYHVVSGRVLSTDLMDGMVVETLNGQSVTVTINDDGVFINDAQVTVADLEAQNGVVHVINAVLIPEEDGGNEDGVAQLFASSNTSGTIGVYELGENGAVSMSTIDGAPMDADGIYYDTETDVLYQLSRTDNVVNAYSNVSSGTPELTATSTSDFSNGREIAISGNRLVVAQDANEGNGMQNRLVVYEFSPTAIELVASYDVTINLWGIHAVEDDLIAIVDNSSDVAIYGGFFDNEETSGTLNVSRLVTVEGLVRTHGVTYDADEDVMYLTDVGEASSDSDGAIIVIDDFSAVIDQEDDDDMDDDNLIDSDEQVRVAGSATLLGNPVDIAYDTENEVIYVAERANGGGRILGFAVPSESGNVEPIYSDDFAGASAVFFSGSMEERIIEPTTIDQRSAITVDLTLFPNPTSSTLNVQVEASEERRVDVQVIDYNGRILQVLAGQVLFSGQNNLQIDASNLANGMYYLRIIGQDVVQDARFMVTK
ncbi:MAG: fasciclin domain-containing protein, partial [Bacteroidota bacterium]